MNLDEFIFDRIKELADFEEWFRQFDCIGDLCAGEWDEQLEMFRLERDRQDSQPSETLLDQGLQDNRAPA
jgi:hypothetical protein